MIEIAIPGYKELKLKYLVMDYNGTLACDGKLIDGVSAYLKKLAARLELHVVTADTFGQVRGEIADLPCKLKILPPEEQSEAKRDYVHALGFNRSVCIGNGRNDRLMLERAALSFAVIQEEGAAGETVRAASIVVPDIIRAFEILLEPLRLKATLRS